MQFFMKLFKTILLFCFAFLGIIYLVLLPNGLPMYEAVNQTIHSLFAWDLGLTKYNASVTSEAEKHFLRSLKILIPAFFISMIFGFLKGMVMYYFQEAKIKTIWLLDRLIFGSLPDFFIYISLQYVLLLLLIKGLIHVDLFGFDRWYNIIIPTIVLSIYPIVYLSNITMKSLQENSSKDYIRTAYSKGTNSYKVLTRHLLWNSWPTILGQAQTVMLYIVTSLPIIELISYYKGAGYLMVYAIKRDETRLIIPLTLMFLAIMFVTIILTEIVKYFLVPSDSQVSLMEQTARKRKPLVWLKKTIHFMKEYPLFSLGIWMVFFLLFIAFIMPYFPYIDRTLNELTFKIDAEGTIIIPPIPPNNEYLIGSDRFGRDLLSLLVMGTKETLWQILIITIIRFVISIPLGYAASFNRTARGISSFLNGVLSFFPTIIIIAILSKIPALQHDNRLYYMILIIAMMEVGRISEMFRMEFTSIRKNEYITAAIGSGANGFQLLKRHFIPNMYQKIIYYFITDMSRVLFVMGLLGFLNIFMEQVNPQGNEWYNNASIIWPSFLGNYLQDIRSATWIPFYTSCFMAYAIFSLSIFGEGLQQYFSKKMRVGATSIPGTKRNKKTMRKNSMQQTTSQKL